MKIVHVIVLAATAVLLACAPKGTDGSDGSSNSGSSGTAGGSSSNASSGASSGAINSDSGLGSECVITGSSFTGCEGITQDQRTCVALSPSATRGVCADNNGCSATSGPCAGVDTKCVTFGMATGAVCAKSCTFSSPSDVSTCGAGNACIYVYPTGAICGPLSTAECTTTTNTSCPGSFTCTAWGTDGYGKCMGPCDDIFANTPCGSTDSCYVTFDGAAIDFVCFPSGTGTLGSDCSTWNGCQPGLICAGNRGGCTPPCDDAHACPNDGTCTRYLGTTGLGFCTYP